MRTSAAWQVKPRDKCKVIARGCYELCELACASTIVPLLLTQLLFYALSPRV